MPAALVDTWSEKLGSLQVKTIAPCGDTAAILDLCMGNSKSRSNGQFEKSIAVRFPVKMMQARSWWRWLTGSLVRCDASQPLMHPGLIEVILKPGQLLLQVRRIPKEKLVQVLAAYCPDEPFNKGI